MATRGFLVVVRGFDIVGMARFPAETVAMLLVHSNTVLAVRRARKSFESVGVRNGQFICRRRA